MLRALINIFRSDDPLGDTGKDFVRMMTLTRDMTLSAGEIYFRGGVETEELTALYKSDVQVNKLERLVRKHVVAHLSLPGNRADVPYCLALMSLVKDVERLGDYAKNLAEVSDIHGDPLPDDEARTELSEIRQGIEHAFSASIDVFSTSDHEQAHQLIQEGRNLAKRCDALLHRIARSDYNAGITTALILGARYYKRIGGHVLNVLTSVVMPLHKLDYYDEDEVPKTVDDE